MKPKIPIKNLILGNSIVILAIALFFIVFGDVFYLFELKTLDIRYILRDMTNNNPPIHKDIINVNIDDYSIRESGKITEWPKNYYSNLIKKVSESNLALWDLFCLTLVVETFHFVLFVQLNDRSSHSSYLCVHLYGSSTLS